MLAARRSLRLLKVDLVPGHHVRSSPCGYLDDAPGATATESEANQRPHAARHLYNLVVLIDEYRVQPEGDEHQKSRTRDKASVESGPDAPGESPPGHRSNAALVASAQAGEPEAWAAIYDANYPAIYRYIRARIFEVPVAEDLAADVFLAALNGIKKYRDRGRPILAWLYGIARNVVADHQRQLSRAGSLSTQRREHSPSQPESSARLSDLAPAGGDPADMIKHLDLQVAIQELTESQREVVILRYFVGLTTGEIAAVLGKDISAIYSLEARAMIDLRKRLGK